MNNFTPGIPSYEEVKQMENILNAFDDFDETPKIPQQRQQPLPSKQNILESHYDSAFDFGDEIPYNEEDSVYYPEENTFPKKHFPQKTIDISFIENNDAKESVEKYLQRNLDLYSKEIQEIICMDEKLNAMYVDAKELKQRHKRCKELNLEDAGKVFARQYKEIGAEIKILELRLKNLNNKINQF